MFRATRYRLYPNKTQERQFQGLCGASRFVYNELLSAQAREIQAVQRWPSGKPNCLCLHGRDDSCPNSCTDPDIVTKCPEASVGVPVSHFP